MFSTLVSTLSVSNHLSDPAWVIVDCRFDMADPQAGRRAYLASHIPGAVYAHLDEDLSGPPATDRGRHPLPTPAALTKLFGRLGIRADTQVVVYDDANGTFAARLWWMLRFMGHEAVAVLEGGWQAWQARKLPMRQGVETNATTLFTGAPRWEWLVQIEDVENQGLLIDARHPDRYQGITEPIDARAGHIPGAKNYFYEENWDANGHFLSPAELAQNYTELLRSVAPQEAVFYCGSGVSACVNLLALAHAGLGNGRLYVGSWSEWSSDLERPAETGL